MFIIWWPMKIGQVEILIVEKMPKVLFLLLIALNLSALSLEGGIQQTSFADMKKAPVRSFF